MKFVVMWESPANPEHIERAQNSFEAWKPNPGVKYLSNLGRVDGHGGFAVVETDDGSRLAQDAHLLAPYFNSQIFPVIEIDEYARSHRDAIQTRKSVAGTTTR